MSAGVALAVLAAALVPDGTAVLQAAADTQRVTIRGQVVDARTRAALAGVRVTIEELGLRLETDVDGWFELRDVPVGTYGMALRRAGYLTSEGDFAVMRPGEFVTPLTPVDAADAPVGRLVGRVTDRESDRGLADVEVRVPALSLAALSGPDGRFRVGELPPGRHAVEFSYLGYATRVDTVEVTRGLTTDARVSLTVDPVALEPVDVTVERREVHLEDQGFYVRREEGWGHFVDQQEIEARNPSELTDLFSGMPRVWLYPDPLNPLERNVVLGTGRSGNFQRTPHPYCFPMVVLDDVIVHRGGREPANIDQLVSPSSVAGIEVYAGVAGVPLEYRGTGAGCGVVMIWTRR